METKIVKCYTGGDRRERRLGVDGEEVTLNNLLALEPREAGTSVLEPTIGFLETVKAQDGRLQIDSTWSQAGDSTWAQAGDSTWS